MPTAIADRHDPVSRRNAGDVHDALAVEHGHRRRLLDGGDERFHVRHRHLGQAHRRQVGEPEVEHARAQRELATVVVDVAELDQRRAGSDALRPRVRPVRRLTSLSVSRGFSPSKARITASPRSSDWTKSLPRCSVTTPSPPVAGPCETTNDSTQSVRRPDWAGYAVSRGGGASRCPGRDRAARPG